MPVPAGAHEEDGGSLSWCERADQGVEVGRQVGAAVGLDLAQGSGKVLAAAERSVDDEQVVAVREAMPMQDRA